MNKQMLNPFVVLLSLAYPFFVYYYASNFSGYVFIGIIITLLLIRGLLKGAQALLIAGGISLLLGIAMLFMHEHASLLYPVLISISMAIMFGYSLLYPPTLIEKFARLQQPNLSPEGVIYTRKVTILWLVFCCVNSLIALATVIAGDINLWALYNGFISYVLMGLLFTGEYMYRKLALGKLKYR